MQVTKSLDFQDEPVTVLELHPGDYFGELALINQDVRAANVIAVGNLTTVTLDRGAFTRLLGPIDHILKRNTDNYNAIEQKIYNEKLQAVSGVTVVPQPLLGAGDANSTQLSMRRRRTAVSSEPVAGTSVRATMRILLFAHVLDSNDVDSVECVAIGLCPEDPCPKGIDSQIDPRELPLRRS